MQMLFSALLALGFLTGAANAAPLTQTSDTSVVEYSCVPRYGH